MAKDARHGLDVVVVTHDSVRWLPGFFGSWREAVGKCGMRNAECGMGVRIVVADSGSADETVNVARELAPGAMVVACGNVGYGAAANRGAAAGAAQGDGAAWVMVCNADLTFAGDFLERLIAAVGLGRGPAASPTIAIPGLGEAGCVAPLLLNEDGSAQASVGRFPTFCGMARDQFRRRARRKYVFPQPTAPGRVDWATGACLLLRRQAFEEVGGFDGKFFLYVEEVDLLRRMRERGYYTWFVPEARVVHHQPNAARVARPEVQRWAARGMLRYFAKFGAGGPGGALLGYRVAAAVSGRLPFGEAFASRKRILERATGP